MSWLEMFREQAEAYNAKARESAKEAKREARKEAYRERERQRVAKFLRDNPEKRKSYRKNFLERQGMTEYEYKHRGYIRRKAKKAASSEVDE